MTTSQPLPLRPQWSPLRSILRSSTKGVAACVSSLALSVGVAAAPAGSTPLAGSLSMQPATQVVEQVEGSLAARTHPNAAEVDNYTSDPAELQRTLRALQSRHPHYEDVSLVEVQHAAKHSQAARVPRIEALNKRRAQVGVRPVGFDPKAQDIADATVAVIAKHTRNAVSRAALYPWINRVTNTCALPDLRFGVMEKREKCYWTFVVDAPRFVDADAALDGVSWGEMLYDAESSTVGVSDGKLAGLGRQFMVFVVRSEFLSIAQRWADYEKWEFERRSSTVEGSGSPKSTDESKVPGVAAQEESGELFSKGASNQLLLPLRLSALQAAFLFHRVDVTVQQNSEAQVLANTLHFFLEEAMKSNKVTP